MSDTLTARDAGLDAGLGAPPAPAPTRTRRVLAKQLLLGATVLAVLAGAGRYGQVWWATERFIESTDDAYVGGNVTALAPHIAGFIAEVAVVDNQRVTAGQMLVRLDRRDTQAAHDRAAAVVDAKQAALAGLHATALLQLSTIRQQEADLAAKASQMSYAGQDADRYRSLAQTSAGSRQDAQRTSSLEQQARSGVLSAAATLEAGRQRMKVLEAQTAEAEATLAQAGSDLQMATLNLAYTDIRAPIDGYVSNRAAQVGAYVAAGAYLVSVVPTTGLWVDANFKEDQLGRMAEGDAATVVADLMPDHVFHGHVASMAHGTGAVFSILPAENATGNFTKIVQRVPVRLLLDGTDAELRHLRPGLSTTARVDIRAPEAATRVHAP